MKIKKKLTFFLLSSTCVVTTIWYLHDAGNKEREEYLLLEKASNISCIIENKRRTYSMNRGILITTSDGSKFNVAWAKNYNYSRVLLSDFIQIGDSINKKEASDSLFVYREGREYYFILNKIINEEYRKKPKWAK